MRSVNKDFNDIPSGLQSGYYENKELQKKLLAQKERHSFDNKIYNQAIISKLRTLYLDKCAFCECKFKEVDGVLKHSFCGKATVEHYRPKAIYYWLVYEWSNLFLTCTICNGHKDNHFDIISNDKRKKATLPLIEEENIDFSKCLANSHELLSEEACFLHPEVDIPVENYFTFGIDGKIEPNENLDKTQERRAKYTIDKIKLNRWELEDARKSIIDDFYNTFLKSLRLILARYKSEEIEDRMLEITFFPHFENMFIRAQVESEYSLLGECLLTQFDTYFLKRLETDYNSIEISKLLAHSFSLFIQNKMKEA